MMIDLVGPNLAVCTAAWCICVQRIASMSKSTTRLCYRVGYAAMCALLAVAGGSRWWLSEPVVWGQFCATVAVLVALLLTRRAWAHGRIPPIARTGEGDFDDEPHFPEHLR